jgi:putative phosphoribosyl transferase
MNTSGNVGKPASIALSIRTTHPETLDGSIMLPEGAESLTILVQANKSRQQTLINKWVSFVLERKRIGTLVLDLAPRNGTDRRFQFDLMSTRWVLQQPALEKLRLGYFGVSIGAGAALVAAAAWGKRIGAVVCAGGRPDLAHDSLKRITSPVLFIVGDQDPLTLDLTRDALLEMHAVNELALIPGATHLFREAGAIDKVGALASAWFRQHLHIRSESLNRPLI